VPGAVSLCDDIVVRFQIGHEYPMSKTIVHCSGPVALVGGGQANAADVAEALTFAKILVAVDGGLATALACGITPAAVVGDMDSAPPEALAQIPPAHQHRITEQYSTDFDKALRHVEAPVVIGVGFCGGRVDHQLAAFHTLANRCDRPCILLAEHEVIAIVPPALSLAMMAGEVVSLFPLAPVTGRSTGLEWPLDGLKFDPVRLVGTSNRAKGPITLQMDAPGMLLIVPRRCLGLLVAHFCADPVRWPAHA
jgi:thiamine pyrophosphokinase